MPLEYDQEPGLRIHIPSSQEQPVSKRFPFRPSSAPPPPYTGPPSPNASEDIPPLPPHLSSSAATSTPLRLPNLTEVSSRRLPTPPDPRVAVPVEQGSATDLLSPHLQSSHTAPLFSSPSTPSLSPQSHVVSPSQFPSISPRTQITKPRSVFHPFSALKLSKATRKATAQIAKQAAWKATEEATYDAELARLRITEEQAVGQAVSQAEAKEVVKSSIRSLLVLSNSSDEDRISVFTRCSQACKNSGLDFSAILQEPLIEGQTPVYWAILNRSATSSEADDAALDSLIIALLNACGSLNETTMASVRLGCMLMSNNILLQRLFWQFPGLSPLSTSDSMLLRPSGGGDVVDVEQKRDSTGAFVASIKLPRFRLRMSVSKVVKTEFVTSERLWMVTFSVHTNNTAEGRSENKWLFSLELANHSTPAWVDADLLVPGRSHQANDSDNNEPIFSVPVRCGGYALQSGHENAIKVRLDEGPMRLHWINESRALIDADGTLHAELSVRFNQPMRPPASLLIPDTSDTHSQISLVPETQASSSHSEPPRSPEGKSKDKRAKKDPNKMVYTSLRRGGR